MVHIAQQSVSDSGNSVCHFGRVLSQIAFCRPFLFSSPITAGMEVSEIVLLASPYRIHESVVHINMPDAFLNLLVPSAFTTASMVSGFRSSLPVV